MVLMIIFLIELLINLKVEYANLLSIHSKEHY